MLFSYQVHYLRWSNSGCPHAKRNLWNLKLPTTRREPEDPCLCWIKLEPIGTHPQTHLDNKRRMTETLFWSSEALGGRKTHRSTSRLHKGESADETILLVAADLQYKEERGSVQGPTLVAPQTKLRWVVTRRCYTERTAYDQ